MITPIEIQKHLFRKAWRGFDPEEVKSFLENLASEFETLTKENASLRERSQNLELQIEDYRKMEKLLHDTLLTAQQLAEGVKQQAEEKAAQIVKEAQLEGAKIAENTRQTIFSLEKELAELKSQKMNFLVRFRSLLEAQLKIIQDLTKEEES